MSWRALSTPFGHAALPTALLVALVVLSPLALLAAASGPATPSATTALAAARPDPAGQDLTRDIGVVTSSGNATATTSPSPATTPSTEPHPAANARPPLRAPESGATRSALTAGAALLGLLVGVSLARTPPMT